MPQLDPDAEPRATPGKRVKAASRVSGSAPALALTRHPGAATVEKGGKKRSTTNIVAEPAHRALLRMRSGESTGQGFLPLV